MKSPPPVRSRSAKQSHPVRGAWIEMTMAQKNEVAKTKSHPVRGAWIEIRSLPSRTASFPVAPREGCVD